MLSNEGEQQEGARIRDEHEIAYLYDLSHLPEAICLPWTARVSGYVTTNAWSQDAGNHVFLGVDPVPLRQRSISDQYKAAFNVTEKIALSHVVGYDAVRPPVP